MAGARGKHQNDGIEGDVAGITQGAKRLKNKSVGEERANDRNFPKGYGEHAYMSQEFSVNPSRVEHAHEESKEETYELIVGKVKFCVKVESISKEGKNSFCVKSCELKNQTGTVIELASLLGLGWKLVLDQDLPSAFAKADLLRREVRLPVYSFTENEYKVSADRGLPSDETIKRDLPLGSFWKRRKVFVPLRKVKETHCIPVFERPEFLLTFLHELEHIRHPNNQNLPEDYDEREYFLAARQFSEIDEQQEEIDCWSKGLENFYSIERRGFDFGDQLNREKVRKHVMSSLKTYNIEEGDERIQFII